MSIWQVPIIVDASEIGAYIDDDILHHSPHMSFAAKPSHRLAAYLGIIDRPPAQWPNLMLQVARQTQSHCATASNRSVAKGIAVYGGLGR